MRTYNAYRVEIHSTYNGQTQMNVMHYAKQFGGIAEVWPSVGDIADRTEAAFTDADSVIGLMPAGFRTERVVVLDQRSEDGEVWTNSIGLAVSAGDSSALAASAVVAKYSTGTRGLAGTGRTFWGPIKASLVAADGRSLAAFAQVEAKVQRFVDLMDDIGGGTGGLAVVSLPPKGPSGNIPQAVVRQVRSTSVSPIIGIQRRRMRG